MGNQAYRDQKRSIGRQADRRLDQMGREQDKRVGATIRVVDEDSDIKRWMEGVETELKRLADVLSNNFRNTNGRISELNSTTQRVQNRTHDLSVAASRIESGIGRLLKLVQEADAIAAAPPSSAAAQPLPPVVPEHFPSLRNMATRCGLVLRKQKGQELYFMAANDYPYTEYKDLKILERDIRQYAKIKSIDLSAYPHDRSADLKQNFDRCGRIMVGSGTDTYDPSCDLAAGHVGPCKSFAAIDQHKLDTARTVVRLRTDD